MEIARHMNMSYDLFVEPREGEEQGSGSDLSGAMNLSKMTPAQLEAWNAAFAEENEAFHAAGLEGEALVRWKYQRYLKNYLRTARGADDSVGRLLDWLDANGLAENTLVVYSSDQGFYLGDHGWYDKRWMYEESLKMPLIVRWPGVVEPGSVNEDLVQNLDYAATFLELAGVEVPDDMQGRSLAPLLRGATPADWRDAIYYHYYEYPGVHAVRRHYGVRTERHKLIRFYGHDVVGWELFDLEKDPLEMNNVHGAEIYAVVEGKLKSELARLAQRYGENAPESLPAAR
jgi:arylsulfatase A-like enzyme